MFDCAPTDGETLCLQIRPARGCCLVQLRAGENPSVAGRCRGCASYSQPRIGRPTDLPSPLSWGSPAPRRWGARWKPSSKGNPGSISAGRWGEKVTLRTNFAPKTPGESHRSP
jgi:hypothetical protein